ncbi:MAG: HEAT repeat domain-containing protein [Planctomycetota bacterium]
MSILALFAIAALLAPQDPPPTKPVRVDESQVIPRSKAKQGGGGKLILPPTRPANSATEGQPSSQATTPQAQDDEVFRKSLTDLRRSLHLPSSKEVSLIEQIGTRFPDASARALAALRVCDADEAYAALLVLQRFGGRKEASDLEYLLLTRSFGSATDVGIDALAALAQDDAAERLLSCLTSNRAPVRFHAERVLLSRVRPGDEARLLDLSRASSGDVRIKTVRLLGSLPATPAVRARLLDALAEEALVADAAVDALVAQGVAPTADLRAMLSRPAVGRSFGYAALALCALHDMEPRTEIFDDTMTAALTAELDMPDAFQRSAVACALVDLAMQSSDLGGEKFRDLKVVQALVDVVAPTQFIEHLVRLKALALPRLARFTGQDFGTSTQLWRRWIEQIGAGPFVGARSDLELTAENAALASLTWRSGDSTIVLHGERVAPTESEDAFDYLLADGEIAALLAELRSAGFMGGDRGEVRLREDRSLLLQIGVARVRTDPETPSALLDRLGAKIANASRQQSWQLWRDPSREPDAAAYWRAERRWREQHTDAAENAARERSRLLAAIARVRGARRPIAFAALTALPDLRASMTEDEGRQILAGASAVTPWDEISFQLVEFALLAPGEQVWRGAVDLAVAHDEADSGAVAVLPRVFALLGPDRLIQCLDADNPAVRRVAMAEVGRLKDLRATPSLLHAAQDPATDAALRVAAVHALGDIRAPDARAALLSLAQEHDIDPALRRSTWVALGQIGGDGVFEALRRAMATPDEADRVALVRALGALRQPEAAFALTEVVAVRKDDTLGSIALEMLRLQGDQLASPALRTHVNAADPVLRGIAALALADFQDPEALPALMTMLDGDAGRLRVVGAIAGITGHDLVRENDRAGAMRSWWGVNRNRSQQDWFLQALAEENVATTLTREQLAPDTGTTAVPELTRLVMELELPHLRALAGRLLRTTTGVDYGTVLPLMNEAQRAAICDRYRLLAESTRSASRK